MGFKKEQEDSRGEVYSFELCEEPLDELMLFLTKEGKLRGGHSHNVREHRVLIRGKVAFKHKDSEGDRIFIMREGDYIEVPEHTPHLMVALEDSWLMEWWAKDKEKETFNYKKYRREVQ